MMDRGRLASLLQLLGSADDTTVLNAARVAHQFVTEAGETWRTALGLTNPPSDGLPVKRHERAAMLLEWFKPRLNEWEKSFLADMSKEKFMTEKQAHHLDRIATKLIGRA